MKNPAPARLKGATCCIASAICYGTIPVGALNLYAEGFDPPTVLSYRFIFALVLLGAVMLKWRPDFQITRREARDLFVLGLLFAISSQSFFSSFKHMPAGIASTLLFVYPLMVTALMRMFGQKFTWQAGLALMLALGGVWLLNRDHAGGSLDLTGVLLVLISAFTHAVYIVIINLRLAHLPALKLTFHILLWSAVLMVLSALWVNQGSFQLPASLRSLGSALWLAVVPTVLALWLLVAGIELAGSVTAAIAGALEPLTAVVVCVLFFDERFTLTIGCGIALILLAVIVITLGRKRPG